MTGNSPKVTRSLPANVALMLGLLVATLAGGCALLGESASERARAACAALDAPPNARSADPLEALKAVREKQLDAARLARSAAESDSKFSDLAAAFAEYTTQLGDAVDAMENYRSGETGGLDFIDQLGTSLQEPTTVRQECTRLTFPTGRTGTKPLS